MSKKDKNKKNKIISINYFRRWNKDIIKLKRELNSKKFSQIKKINIKYTKSLLNNGLHLVDLCLYLIGKPDEVNNIKKNNFKYKDKNYGYDFNFVYKKRNIEVTFQNLPGLNYVFIDFEIFFEDYYIHIKKRSQSIEYYKKTKDKKLKDFYDLKLIKKQNTGWDKSILNAVKELIKTKSQEHVGHSLLDSLELLNIYDRITK